MKRLLILFSMTALVMLSSCNPSDKDGAPPKGGESTEEGVDGGWDDMIEGSPEIWKYDGSSWVLCFYEPCYKEPEGSWKEGFWMNVFLWDYRNYYTPWSRSEEFYAMCEKQGDVGYDVGERTIALIDGDWFRPQALTTNYTSIEIVAPLVDFDEEHPAGTSLNDLVRVRYSTLYPFIRDGYNVQPDTSYTDGYLECDKKLTDITAEDLRLLGPNLRFNFSKTPPYAMKIFMQIILTDEYGQKHLLEKNIFNDNYEYKQPGGF